MFGINFISSSTISKILRNKVNKDQVYEDRVDSRCSNGDKNSTSLFASQKLFGADYLIFKAKKAFNLLQDVFIQVLVLHYFGSKYHIHIEANMSSYAISRILSRLISNNLG